MEEAHLEIVEQQYVLTHSSEAESRIFSKEKAIPSNESPFVVIDRYGVQLSGDFL